MTIEKHALIRGILADAFRGHVIEEAKDDDRGTWRFEVLLPHSPLVAFSGVFVEDSTPDQIEAAFQNWRIVDLMRDNPDRRVLVTAAGAKLERRA